MGKRGNENHQIKAGTSIKMKVVIDKSERLQKAPQALLGVMRLTERLLKPRGLEYIDLDSITPEIPDYPLFLAYPA